MAGAVTWVDNDVATAVKLNALPRGVMAHADGSTNSGIGATPTVLTGVSIVFTAESTRRYKTTLVISRVDQITSASVATAVIADAAGAVRGSAVTNIAASGFSNFTVTASETGLSGSITRQGRLSTSAGTINTVAPAPFIWVEDLGPA